MRSGSTNTAKVFYSAWLYQHRAALGLVRNGPQTFLENAKQIQRRAPYESRVARNLSRNTAELARLQAERRLTRSQGLAWSPQDDGFGFSTLRFTR